MTTTQVTQPDQNGMSEHEEAAAIANELAAEAPKRRRRIATPASRSSFAELKAEADEARAHAESAHAAVKDAAKKLRGELAAQLAEVDAFLTTDPASPGLVKVAPQTRKAHMAKAPKRVARPRRERAAVGPVTKPSIDDVVAFAKNVGPSGVASSDVQKQFGLSRSQASVVLKAVVASGVLSTRGERRGMRYFVK